MAVRHARDENQKGGSIRRPAVRQTPQHIALWLRGDNFFSQIDMNFILNVVRERPTIPPRSGDNCAVLQYKCLATMWRDGVTPCFDHVKEVADSLQGWDLKTVGILHDTLEDTSVTAASLRALGFPDRIVRAVEAMTKPDGANYLEYVRDQVKQNPLARLVKLADLAANLKNNDRADQVAKYTSAQIILQNE